jgi:hypothetical protein
MTSSNIHTDSNITFAENPKEAKKNFMQQIG